MSRVTQFHLIDGSDHRNHKEWVLHFSLKLKTAVVGAVAAVVLAAGASAASAAPAAWVGIAAGGGTPTTVSGTLTMRQGAYITTCSFPTTPGSFGSGASNQTATQGIAAGAGYLGCANGNLFSLKFLYTASKNAGAFSLTNAPAGQYEWDPFHPGYQYYGAAYTVPFTNGAGAVTSKITFNNTVIGTNGLNATGVISITRSGGALLTLS